MNSDLQIIESEILEFIFQSLLYKVDRNFKETGSTGITCRKIDNFHFSVCYSYEKEKQLYIDPTFIFNRIDQGKFSLLSIKKYNDKEIIISEKSPTKKEITSVMSNIKKWEKILKKGCIMSFSENYKLINYLNAIKKKFETTTDDKELKNEAINEKNKNTIDSEHLEVIFKSLIDESDNIIYSKNRSNVLNPIDAKKINEKVFTLTYICPDLKSMMSKTCRMEMTFQRIQSKIFSILKMEDIDTNETYYQKTANYWDSIKMIGEWYRLDKQIKKGDYYINLKIEFNASKISTNEKT